MNATHVSAIWLEILRAHRPMKYAELIEAVPELSHAQRGRALSTAFRLGYIERDGSRRNYTYSVTPRCTVPTGVPVVEIMEATS